MISEKMYVLGSKQSCIREIFELGLKRKQQVGEENVFDTRLGILLYPHTSRWIIPSPPLYIPRTV